MMGKKMNLITLDVGHMVTTVCVGTLIPQVVAIVFTSETVEKIVKSFQDIAM